MTMTHRVGTWVAATVLSVAGGLVPVANAQVQPASSLVQTAKTSGAMGEGIKVHGHWTVVVRNPDGTQVGRHEFENALDRGGLALLPAFLGRRLTPGSWVINVWDGLCPGEATCRIVESFSEIAASATTSTNLVVNVPAYGTAGPISLSGSFTAVTGGHITRVATQLGACGADRAPSICNFSGYLETLFSSTVLTTPIPVQQGQIVQVTVRISFS